MQVEELSMNWVQTFHQLPTWTFFGLVAVLVILEWIAPQRPETTLLPTRWASNAGLVLMNAYLLRWLAPAAGITWALWCQSRSWGLFYWWHAPELLAVVIGVLSIVL